MVFYSFTYALGGDLLHTTEFPGGFVPDVVPQRGDLVAVFVVDMPWLDPVRVVDRAFTYAVNGSDVYVGISFVTERPVSKGDSA